jgi:hypothetical protein
VSSVHHSQSLMRSCYHPHFEIQKLRLSEVKFAQKHTVFKTI